MNRPSFFLGVASLRVCWGWLISQLGQSPVRVPSIRQAARTSRVHLKTLRVFVQATLNANCALTSKLLAIAVYREAIRLDPKAELYYEFLGHSLSSHGMFEEALERTARPSA